MKHKFPMLIVLLFTLFAPFSAQAHIADCHIDVSDNYLENEFLGKSLDESKEIYLAKEFEVSRYGDEWIETRLDICGSYELALVFSEDRVVAVYSGASIFKLGQLNIFNIILADAPSKLPDGRLEWMWHEGQEIFYRFDNSNLSLSFGHMRDAEVCLASLDECELAQDRYAEAIFTYK